MRPHRAFCGLPLLLALLAAIAVIAFFELHRLSPSAPPQRILSEIEAWNQALRFARDRVDPTQRVLFPVYSPAFVRQTSPDRWEIAAPLDFLDADGLPAGRKRFRVLEKWEDGKGWTLLEFSLDP